MINIKLSHTLKSYGTVFLIGIFIGCICRLLDYCSSDSLWGFSSIQTLLGFWIITNTIIVLLSTSNIPAKLSVVIVLPTPPLAENTQILVPLLFIVSSLLFKYYFIIYFHSYNIYFYFISIKANY